MVFRPIKPRPAGRGSPSSLFPASPMAVWIRCGHSIVGQVTVMLVGPVGAGWEWGVPMREQALFESSVNREFVHKRSVSEVLLTDFVESGPDRFIAGAQWPRWHVFYGVPDASPDSALMAETLRQAVIFLSHQSGVPLTHKFLMPHMGVSVRKAALDPLVPTQVDLELEVTDKKFRGGELSNLTVEAKFSIGGEPIGEGTAGARIVNPATYERFRGVAPAAPAVVDADLLACDDVGHAAQRNVMLGTSVRPSVWPLRVDPTHPIFFDHPLDHVPGMLLVEAARQALRAASSRPDADFASFEAEFVKLVEFSYPIDVAVTPAAAGRRCVQEAMTVTMLHRGEAMMTVLAVPK
ncbi:ScbA/BarX family gamma-butyrolactone biosynthesis protein [Arthrobacter terricola]|uniref:A-factor biosynthesis protein n=2 Tax=Arthrobacter TaxID=1663 RepID=A0A4R5KVH4_9MICC|nr:ScbA/BarX family gamma-butyrolactone biosynthesis protein [Arthrobacter terricola]TDF99979.1 A-factor biosynthesis protein [Arthrobacter terricola]